MNQTLLVLAIVLTVGLHAQAEPTVSAHVVGQNYGEVDTNIVVSAKEQTAFHFHSDFEGGGTWYETTISIKGKHVTIVERDSISTPYKGGSKVKTTEHIFRLPVDKIAGDEIELSHGNRIVLTKAKETSPTTESTPTK
jgi:hypothetical protein